MVNLKRKSKLKKNSQKKSKKPLPATDLASAINLSVGTNTCYVNPWMLFE
jgi:hypothetical protein